MNITNILTKLIDIPSFVEGKNNESAVAEWVYRFLKSKTKLSVKRQYLSGKRFNVIATNSNKTDLLLTGHMDTVKPTTEWTKDPFKAIRIGDKIYGLGSTDMKSGLSIMLSLATRTDLRSNCMFLFYCDEEYDFLGMKKFIGEYKGKINPKLIVSFDGIGLQVGNSCRGLIEMKVTAKGKAGHAARPKSGINAITESFGVIEKLKQQLKQFSNKELGNSTLNVAYFSGGTKIKNGNKNKTFIEEGNVIADYVEFIIEIRVASNKLNARFIQNFIEKESKRKGLTVCDIRVRHDLGSWITSKQNLVEIIKIAPNKNLKNAKDSGYIDIQMLWKTFNKVPSFSYGVGELGMSHKANEFVKVENIQEGQKFFESILINK